MPAKKAAFVRVNQVTVSAAGKPATAKSGAAVVASPAAASATKKQKKTQKQPKKSLGTKIIPVGLNAKAANKKKKSTGKGKKDGDKHYSSKRWWRKIRPYIALQLRNLPPAFQEPQLRKFLLQFGVAIKAMYIVRTKPARTSRGIAYVAFDPRGRNHEQAMQMLDIVLDECDNMNLGGRTVSAKWVRLKRRMPSRAAADATRQVEWLRKTEGVLMHRHDMSHFDWVEKLQRGAKTEAAGNAFLAKIGVQYAFHGFAEQAKLLTPALIEASRAAQASAQTARVAKAAAEKFGYGNQKKLLGALAAAADKKQKKLDGKNNADAAAAAGASLAASLDTAAAAASGGAVAPRGKASPAGKKAAAAVAAAAAAVALPTSVSTGGDKKGKKAPPAKQSAAKKK